MLDGFSIKSLGLGRGKYKPVREQPGSDGAEDDPDVHSQKPSKRPSFLWLYLMLSAFCGFIFAIALVNLFPDNLIKGGDPAQTKLQKLVQFPTEKVVFSPIEVFEEKPSPESDMMWQGLLGPSLGMVSLNNSEELGLPPGAAKGHVYQVSMAHQIQCLYLIRKVYWGASSGIYDVSAEPQSGLVTTANDCFDYLLQSVKCAADMSLEWKTDEAGNFVPWEVPHTCSSWKSVMGFMTKYKHAEAEKATNHHDHDNDDK